jgi:N-acetylglucosaminyl-diphospho-decaprenol L-rhamnosyltransferase
MSQAEPAIIPDAGFHRPVSVDILIVSHNTRELLGECLASIARCGPPEDLVKLGIKIFDNGSTDGTAEMIAERFPHVEFVSSPTNEGFARANNQLAANSCADYLLLLNPDTVWITDIVEPLLDTLRSTPAAVIAGPRLSYPNGEVQLSSQHRPSLTYELALPLRGTKLGHIGRLWDAERVVESTREQHLCDSRVPRRTQFLWATCWLIARADVERYGLFDARFALYDEDLDLCTRLAAVGRSIIYRADLDLVHVGGASSTSATKLKLMRAARARYYRVHHGRGAELIYRYAVLTVWRLRLSRQRRTPAPG